MRASQAELEEVEGVGGVRAREIREGLRRLQEQNIVDRYLKTQVYGDPEQWWDGYEMAEKLVDVEERFQLWRFRHMMTVHRIIGFKPGTGGSSGVPFLKRALDVRFFPELCDVRTELEAH